MIRLLWEKVSNFFAQEVPRDIAACEFDCRKKECLHQDFQNCPKRLKQLENLKIYPEKHTSND